MGDKVVWDWLRAGRANEFSFGIVCSVWDAKWEA